MEDVVAAGYKNSEGLCFRTPACGSNQVLAQIPPGQAPTGSIDYGVQVSQAKLCTIIRKHALKQAPFFSLRYNTRYISHQEDENDASGLVRVEVESYASASAAAKGITGEVTTIAARFVAACDGANSAVRESLKIPFEGFTWKDWRFVAVNIYYDFAKHGYPAANHVVDPENWAVIVRASSVEEGLWRIAMGIPTDVQTDDIDDYVTAKVERLLPGPRPFSYKIEAISPYWAHEKVIQSFRSGRVVFCGDSAHVSPPQHEKRLVLLTMLVE